MLCSKIPQYNREHYVKHKPILAIGNVKFLRFKLKSFRGILHTVLLFYVTYFVILFQRELTPLHQRYLIAPLTSYLTQTPSQGKQQPIGKFRLRRIITVQRFSSVNHHLQEPHSLLVRRLSQSISSQIQIKTLSPAHSA